MRRVGVRRPAPAAPRRSPRTACASTTCARSSTRWPTPTRCSSCARDFGIGMVTALVRVEGPADRHHRQQPRCTSAGAIDSDGADKAARFMQLCDAYDIPILFLCDTPGIMVGPEVETTALVRHFSRMFVTGGQPDRARSSPSCCARATASAPRRWPAAASRRRCSPWPGRPASSAAWASRAR